MMMIITIISETRKAKISYSMLSTVLLRVTFVRCSNSATKQVEGVKFCVPLPEEVARILLLCKLITQENFVDIRSKKTSQICIGLDEE
jgi:hypothetical protein